MMQQQMMQQQMAMQQQASAQAQAQAPAVVQVQPAGLTTASSSSSLGPLQGGTINATDLNGKWTHPCPNCLTLCITHDIQALDSNKFIDKQCGLNIFHLIPQ